MAELYPLPISSEDRSHFQNPAGEWQAEKPKITIETAAAEMPATAVTRESRLRESRISQETTSTEALATPRLNLMNTTATPRVAAAPAAKRRTRSCSRLSTAKIATTIRMRSSYHNPSAARIQYPTKNVSSVSAR